MLQYMRLSKVYRHSIPIQQYKPHAYKTLHRYNQALQSLKIWMAIVKDASVNKKKLSKGPRQNDFI